jgi:hypothetical protein
MAVRSGKMPTTLFLRPWWSGLTDPADMFASQDPADKPLREVREMIATMRDPRELPRGSRRILRRNRRFVSNLWESSQISGRPKTGDCGRRIRMPDPTRDRRQHKRQVLKMNQASWNVAHVAAYEFFGCVTRARGPRLGTADARATSRCLVTPRLTCTPSRPPGPRAPCRELWDARLIRAPIGMPTSGFLHRGPADPIVLQPPGDDAGFGGWV